MDLNDLIQYSLVLIVVLGATVWLFVRVRRVSRRGGGCHGCALSDRCSGAAAGKREKGGRRDSPSCCPDEKKGVKK